MAGSSETYSTLTSTWPGPGADNGLLAISKSSLLGSPTGRRTSLTWVFVRMFLLLVGCPLRRAPSAGRSCLGQHPAVDDDAGSIGVAGGIRGEIKHGAGHFLRFGGAAQRDVGDGALVDFLVLDQGGSEAGFGQARQQRVDADAQRAALLGEGLSHVD